MRVTICGKFLILCFKLLMPLRIQATFEASAGASDASLDGYSSSVTQATKSQERRRRDPAKGSCSERKGELGELAHAVYCGWLGLGQSVPLSCTLSRTLGNFAEVRSICRCGICCCAH